MREWSASSSSLRHEMSEAAEWARRFDTPPRGPEKVVPLREAVRSGVRPGMTLHLAFTDNRPTAAIAEILRQFRGTDPGFTLILLFTAGPAVALLTEGLTRRLVTTLIGEPYPAPAPSAAARRGIITLPSGPGCLVAKLAFVTGPGDRVTAVVTDLGIFEKAVGPGALRLTRLVGPLVGGSREAHVRELSARCGFPFEQGPKLPVDSPPSREEIERLRLFDPERAFLGPLDSHIG